MTEAMNLSVNGQSQVPPGFRFHPTEEELLHYYLRKKVASEKIDLDVIRDVDLNKLEPWDIQERCRIGSTPQNDWYFFSHKDKKYPTGTRTNRATAAGFWKATGRDKVIHSNRRRIGMRKTLVFYMGRAPHGQKSDWIMHEYRLEEHSPHNTNDADFTMEDGWVVCRVFRKKNNQRSVASPKISRTQMITTDNNTDDDNIDHDHELLFYMGRNFKRENDNINPMANNHVIDHNMRFLTAPNNNISLMDDRFLHLPRLDSPTFDQLSMNEMREFEETKPNPNCDLLDATLINDWSGIDYRLVVSQLNGPVSETSKQLSCFSTDPNNSLSPFNGVLPEKNHVQISHQPVHQASQIYGSEIDLWSFTRSSSSSSLSDPLSHFSV